MLPSTAVDQPPRAARADQVIRARNLAARYHRPELPATMVSVSVAVPPALFNPAAAVGVVAADGAVGQVGRAGIAAGRRRSGRSCRSRCSRSGWPCRNCSARRRRRRRELPLTVQPVRVRLAVPELNTPPP